MKGYYHLRKSCWSTRGRGLLRPTHCKSSFETKTDISSHIFHARKLATLLRMTIGTTVSVTGLCGTSTPAVALYIGAMKHPTVLVILKGWVGWSHRIGQSTGSVCGHSYRFVQVRLFKATFFYCSLEMCSELVIVTRIKLWRQTESLKSKIVFNNDSH